jgi:hypothetical protein
LLGPELDRLKQQAAWRIGVEQAAGLLGDELEEAVQVP